MIISRRETLALGAAAAAASLAGLTAPALAQGQVSIDEAKLMAPEGLTDHVLGSKDAKVTMIEYGSAQCPHCGRFYRDVFPQLKEKYVDTGKIKFIFRPFPLSVFDLAIFTLAEIAGDDHFYTVVDAYYAAQDKWAGVDKPGDAIQAIALQLGFTEDSYKQALTNQDWPKRIQQARDQATSAFQVTGTPTFFINGKQLVGEQTIEQFSAVIDPLLT